MDKINMFSLALSRLYDEALISSPSTRLTIMCKMHLDEPLKIAGMEMTRKTMDWAYYLVYPEEMPDVLVRFIDDMKVKIDEIKKSINAQEWIK